jgi:hypothetical protein
MSEIKSKQKLTQTHCTVFRSSRFILWSLYVGFVVYGSLVPLDFHYLPWGQAWESFKTVKLLDVGAQGRADWLSNGVLYVPVGFFTVNLLIEQKTILHQSGIWSFRYCFHWRWPFALNTPNSTSSKNRFTQ